MNIAINMITCNQSNYRFSFIDLRDEGCELGKTLGCEEGWFVGSMWRKEKSEWILNLQLKIINIKETKQTIIRLSDHIFNTTYVM